MWPRREESVIRATPRRLLTICFSKSPKYVCFLFYWSLSLFLGPSLSRLPLGNMEEFGGVQCFLNSFGISSAESTVLHIYGRKIGFAFFKAAFPLSQILWSLKVAPLPCSCEAWPRAAMCSYGGQGLCPWWMGAQHWRGWWSEHLTGTVRRGHGAVSLLCQS